MLKRQSVIRLNRAVKYFRLPFCSRGEPSVCLRVNLVPLVVCNRPHGTPVLQNLLPELQRQLLYNQFAEFHSYRGQGCKYTGNHIGDLIVTGINKNV